NPDWFGRDRFVLSAGHACMLLYAVLYLTGYDLSLDDIKQFRQWGSRTPGHSEHALTPGVEATTGPLGQGVGNAVGMALAEAHLAQLFNQPGHSVLDHCTYFLASDGDLMEGASHEACSLAGHLKLGRLVGIYDDNRITIDGKTDLTFSDDTAKRFESYGWHVERVADGNDLGALDAALAAARRVAGRPPGRRLGRGPPDVRAPPRRCPGHARGVGEGAERHRAEAPRARRRVGGSRRLDARRLQERGRRGSGELGRPQYPFRRTRARDGRDPERPRPASWCAARGIDVPHFLRLHAAADPPCRAVRSAGDLRLHPRLHRPRGGRAHASADRAARRAARDPQSR